MNSLFSVDSKEFETYFPPYKNNDFYFKWIDYLFQIIITILYQGCDLKTGRPKLLQDAQMVNIKGLIQE